MGRVKDWVTTRQCLTACKAVRLVAPAPLQTGDSLFRPLPSVYRSRWNHHKAQRRAALWDAADDGAPSAAVVAKARRQVADFLARVLKLAGLRLSDLCDRLSFASVDRNDVLAQVFAVRGLGFKGFRN